MEDSQGMFEFVAMRVHRFDFRFIFFSSLCLGFKFQFSLSQFVLTVLFCMYCPGPDDGRYIIGQAPFSFGVLGKSCRRAEALSSAGHAIPMKFWQAYKEPRGTCAQTL